MSLFKKGFLKYKENGDFADVTLVADGQISLMTSEFKESSQKTIELKFEDPDNVFPEVLSFMYKGCITITEENSIPILAMADKYLIQSLRDQCIDYIHQNITPKNALAIAERALTYKAEEVVFECVEVIAKNYCQYGDIDWGFLPVENILQLLQHKYLAVKDEYKHYKMICKYIANNELSDEQAKDFFATLRFRWLTFEQLLEVEKNKKVPRYLIIEALFVRVRDNECPQTPSPYDALTCMQPRVCYGRQFRYQFDFDKEGIIYWAATKGGAEPWQNPHFLKSIVVHASSSERGNPHEVLSRTPSELWTKDVPASWISIDLGKNKVAILSCYTLRHGGNYRGDSLRTWDFQGSADGKHWVTIRRHANDKSFNTPFATHTWSLTTDTPFRMFRILQTGHNSSNHNFLVVSGIELYGDLYEIKRP